VYADELTSQGDPLGALIVLQTTDRESNPILELELTTKLRQRIGLSGRELQAIAMEWRWGFVDTLTFKGIKGADHAKLLSTLLAAPPCRFVRHLKIQLAHLSAPESVDASWLAEVQNLQHHELLKRLSCTAGIKSFGTVATMLPKLEHLSLGVRGLPAKKHFAALPLKSLEFTGLVDVDLDSYFHKPPWTELTHLKVEPEVSSVNEVLARCPLTSLDLPGAPALLTDLMLSPHLGKLQKLTLRRVSGVQPLLARRADLKNLSLHLIDGHSTPEDIGTLKASLKQVTFVGVQGPTQTDGYTRPVRL
jgi:hypothetical protein